MLAVLPQLQNLTLSYDNAREDNNKYFSDEVFENFTSLKSLELLVCEKVTNANLFCIAKYCLELQSLKIYGAYSKILHLFYSHFPNLYAIFLS